MLLDSVLESKRFNIKAGKIKISDENELKTDLALAAQQGYQFLSCRIPTKDVFLMQAAEAQGFFLTDTLVYYKKAVATGDSLATSPSYMSALGNDMHLKEVVELAEGAFKNYPSHYATDVRLDQTQAAAVYRDWAERSCVDRTVASDILVLLESQRVVAFVSTKDHQTFGDIQLAAVDPAHQGKGYLSQLLRAALAWSSSRGHEVLKYSTQIQNVAAQKVLAREGWEIHESFYTLHKWL